MEHLPRRARNYSSVGDKLRLAQSTATSDVVVGWQRRFTEIANEQRDLRRRGALVLRPRGSAPGQR
jgi:hypothetical protein